MHTITFCSFKGGTAKTSTALHIGSCLAKYHKKRVLLVDFDSQANLSIGLNFGPDNLNTAVPVLQDKAQLKDSVQKTCIPNLSLVPANALLDQIEKSPELNNDPYAHERLRRALKTVEGEFDFCFIDTPPSLGWLTQSAFFASQHSVICAIPEAYSVIALGRLKEFHDSINRYHTVQVLGVLLTFWDERGAINQSFMEEIDRSFPSKVFQAKVRRDVAVSRAVLQGKPVIEIDPNTRASQDYQALTNEFLLRLESIDATEMAGV